MRADKAGRLTRQNRYATLTAITFALATNSAINTGLALTYIRWLWHNTVTAKIEFFFL